MSEKRPQSSTQGEGKAVISAGSSEGQHQMVEKTPLQQELHEVQQLQDDLRKRLLELEEEALLLDKLSKSRSVVDELLGKERGPGEEELKARMARQAVANQKEHLRGIQSEVEGEVVEKHRLNSNLMKLSLGWATWNNRLRALVQISLLNQTGKQALKYKEDPIGEKGGYVGEKRDATLPVEIDVGRTVNKYLQDLVNARETANSTRADGPEGLAKKLSITDRKKLIDNTKVELENRSLQDMKDDPDVLTRMRAAMYEEMTGEKLRPLSKKAPDGLEYKSFEAMQDPIEQLRRDPRFAELQRTLRSIPGLGTGEDAIEELKHRGGVNPDNNNDFMSNVMLLALGVKDQKVIAAISNRLENLPSGEKTSLVGIKSIIDSALDFNLALASLTKHVIEIVGIKPNLEASKRFEMLLKSIGDLNIMEQLRVIARLSEAENRSPAALRTTAVYGDSRGRAYSGDPDASSRNITTKLREMDEKVKTRMAGAVLSPGELSASSETSEGLAIPDTEIIRWLEASDLYGEFSKLVTDDEMKRLIKKHLGLNLEKQADMAKFLTQYRLKNITTNSGERVIINEEAVPAEEYADDSHLPVGDLIQFIRARKQNPEALLPESLRAHYAKVRQAVDLYARADLDLKLSSADSFLQNARSGLKLSFAIIKAFVERRKNLPPTIADLKELIHEFVERRPHMKERPMQMSYVMIHSGVDDEGQAWLKDWDFDFEVKDDDGNSITKKWPSADGTVAAMMTSPNPKNFRAFLQERISTDEIVGNAELEEKVLEEFEAFLKGEGEGETDLTQFAR